MAPHSKCDFVLHNNPQGVYYGGQLLSGVATLTTYKSKTIRCIHITINGYAKVRWTERKSRTVNGKSRSYTQTYTGDEQYLQSRTVVVGESGGNSIQLPAGEFSYTFQMQLPHQLPTSFDGKHGHIRYDVVLTVDRPFRFDNMFVHPFTVISQLDLNLNPVYRTPMEREEEKEFWCGCCNIEPLKARVIIPYSGFALGQKVHFTILISNESTIDCTGVKVKLLKTVRYTSQSPDVKTKTVVVTLAEKRFGQVLRYSRKEYKDFLELQSTSPSSLQTCSIIHVYYSLLFTVKYPGCHNNTDMELPITIGTIPLLESATNPLSQAITIQPTAPSSSGDGSDSPPGYGLIAPPSYEQAINHQEQFDDDDEVTKHVRKEPFLPKYPVYYNFQSPSAPNDGINAPTNTNNNPPEYNATQGTATTYGWSGSGQT